MTLQSITCPHALDALIYGVARDNENCNSTQNIKFLFPASKRNSRANEFQIFVNGARHVTGDR